MVMYKSMSDGMNGDGVHSAPVIWRFFFLLNLGVPKISMLGIDRDQCSSRHIHYLEKTNQGYERARLRPQIDDLRLFLRAPFSVACHRFVDSKLCAMHQNLRFLCNVCIVKLERTLEGKLASKNGTFVVQIVDGCVAVYIYI